MGTLWISEVPGDSVTLALARCTCLGSRAFFPPAGVRSNAWVVSMTLANAERILTCFCVEIVLSPRSVLPAQVHALFGCGSSASYNRFPPHRMDSSARAKLLRCFANFGLC